MKYKMDSFKILNKKRDKMMKASNNLLEVMRKMQDSMVSKLINSKWNHIKINMILNKIKSFSKKKNIQHEKTELVTNNKIKQMKVKTS